MILSPAANALGQWHSSGPTEPTCKEILDSSFQPLFGRRPLNPWVLVRGGYYYLLSGRIRALACFLFTVTNAPSFSPSSNCIKEDKTTADNVFGDTS